VDVKHPGRQGLRNKCIEAQRFQWPQAATSMKATSLSRIENRLISAAEKVKASIHMGQADYSGNLTVLNSAI
jgi:hypothetical protein